MIPTLERLESARGSLRKARSELREMEVAQWADEELKNCVVMIGKVMEAMSALSLDELKELERRSKKVEREYRVRKGKKVKMHQRNYTQEMLIRQNKRLSK